MDNDFNPLVSIIIPVFNGEAYVGEAIDSALNQTYSNIEVIVVDDGSTDSTNKIVRSYGRRVRYFLKQNGGVGSALNLAVSEAKGEFISWLSHDDIYYAYKIAEQIKELKKAESPRDNTILFSNFDIFDEDQKKLIKVAPIKELSHDSNLYTYQMLKVFFGSKLNGCTLLIPKRLFKSISAFDVKQKTTQDYDLFVKFLKEGVKYHYTPLPLIISRHHEKQDTKRLIGIHLVELNSLYKYTFDLFYSYFSELSFWQFNEFLSIISSRGLDKVYSYMLEKWANATNKNDKPFLWLYWQNGAGLKTPDYIKACWKTIVLKNRGDFNIKILDETTVEGYLAKINDKLTHFDEIAHKADYIRFSLLYKYGGIWLDSDFICLRSLSNICEKIDKYGFVFCGYNHANGAVFPLIGFLGAKKGNIICRKTVKDMDRLTARLVSQQKQPQWDEVGGWILSKYVTSKKLNHYMFQTSYFLPYSIHTSPIEFFCSKNMGDLSAYINEINPFTYGQQIGNNILPNRMKLLNEQKLLSENTVFSKLIALGLSNQNTNYLLGEPVNKKSRFLRNINRVERNIIILFYKLDKIFPKRIRLTAKKFLVKLLFFKHHEKIF